MSMTVMTPLTITIDYGEGYGAEEPVLFCFSDHAKEMPPLVPHLSEDIDPTPPFFTHLSDDIMRMQRAHVAKMEGFLNGVDAEDIEFIAHTVTWGEDTDEVADMLEYVEADRSFIPVSVETTIHLYGEAKPVFISTMK